MDEPDGPCQLTDSYRLKRRIRKSVRISYFIVMSAESKIAITFQNSPVNFINVFPIPLVRKLMTNVAPVLPSIRKTNRRPVLAKQNACSSLIPDLVPSIRSSVEPRCDTVCQQRVHRIGTARKVCGRAEAASHRVVFLQNAATTRRHFEPDLSQTRRSNGFLSEIIATATPGEHVDRRIWQIATPEDRQLLSPLEIMF